MIKVGATGMVLALMLTGCSQLGVQSSGSDWKHQGDTNAISQHGRYGKNFNEGNRELITVRSGDSLLGMLSDAGVSSRFFYDLGTGDQNKMKRLYPGDKIEIFSDVDGEVLRLSREIRDNVWLVAERMGNRIMVSEQPLVSYYDEKIISADIGYDLKADLRSQGMSTDLIDEMLALMTPSIDWMATYNPGDRFRIILRQPMLDDKPAGDPEIKSLKITHKGQLFYAFRHQMLSGMVAYYDENGKSLSPGWILHPVKEFDRISSHFNPHRRHPITGRVRPHNGVDFAAKRGTPIYAASNGTVDFSGNNGGYGNYIAIQHPGGIESRYAHMSRIESGIKKNIMVKKGDLIGYVGTTGLSTGPHLHYEVHIDGVAVDPLKANLATAGELKGVERARFMASRDDIKPVLASGRDFVAMR